MLNSVNTHYTQTPYKLCSIMAIKTEDLPTEKKKLQKEAL